ncbi:hypothetical protein JTE90_020738 [Oedothorax gibbosus]|uniref:Uncharacterized protein n=1 Tax=Oedothorax gibbosus TaxID=931172 RepID=A0AAV6TKA7_9ARAC|nr:hypothetical protein JTE90_020738 [Oedothorax gibbosus]
MCRITNYSKYVGDILDVLFNPEVLGNSVIRGIKGTQKSVLDPKIINDVQQHVAAKFSISIQLLASVSSTTASNSSHKDNETSLDPASTIPTLSFGATRKDFPSKCNFSMDLFFS